MLVAGRWRKKIKNPIDRLLLFAALASISLLTPQLVYSADAESPQDASVSEVLDVQERYQDAGVQSQQRIDELDDETVALLSQYHSELERLADLETYNTNMRQMRTSQELEKERLREELTEVEVVRRELFPLMVEMIDLLDRFIELDQPLLLVERKARLTALRENLNRSNVSLGEKYRRVIEAYQIEAEYGRSIEAYEGSLSIGGRELTVDFLRVGRLALYYVSLDGSEAGLWDPTKKQWHSLEGDFLPLLDFALRVARKQAPPNLLQLPLWTAGANP